jgi:hypothetical protein
MLSADKTHLSLAYLDLPEIPGELCRKHGATVHHLDLSGNRIGEWVIFPSVFSAARTDGFPLFRFFFVCSADLMGLESFPQLSTLVLDENNITWRVQLPRLPKLQTLCANKNGIDNLSAFLDRVVRSSPELHYLSLLQNPCCPNFLTGGTPKQYRDYR